MTISKTLFGASVDVPETPEEDWGDDVTGYNVSLIDGVDASVAKSGSTYYPKGSVASVTFTGTSDTLTRTAHKMRVQTNNGQQTLATSTPIAAGTVDGEELVIIGISDSNPIRIQDGGTAAGFNGDINFTSGVTLHAWWDDTSSLWREIGRSRC